MKHTWSIILMVLSSNMLRAQYMQVAPALPSYPIVNQPGKPGKMKLNFIIISIFIK